MSDAAELMKDSDSGKGSGDKPQNWLGRAMQGLRKFAYAGTPQRLPAPPVLGPMPKIGLALGGGFARGIAHLGVLHSLEEQNIPISCIAGTSAGALAGMAYASGLPFAEIVREASAIRFGNFGQWRFSRMGLASNQRLESYPAVHLGVKNFEDLKIPMAVAATDLISGEAVYFTKGPLGPALRASCAYPGLFRPVEYQDKLLVDGFLAAGMPIEGARMLGAEVVIAVFLEAESLEKPQHVVDVIGRSFSIVRLQADVGWRPKAEVVIVPHVREFAWDDFARTSEMVAAGEAAAKEALPRINEVLQAYRTKGAGPSTERRKKQRRAVQSPQDEAKKR